MTTHPAGSNESLSLWIDTSGRTNYSPLSEDSEADVAIVGGGITGILTAYLLTRAGKQVVLVEKGRIAMSETGHTTAHIVESADADYEQLIKEHGDAGALLNTSAIREAIILIQSLVEEIGIDCDFHPVDGYLYTENEEDRESLEREQKNLAKAGVQTEWVDEIPLPFSTAGGLRFSNQYVFHIRDFLLPIVKEAVKGGARIFENTMVTDLADADEGGLRTLTTDRGTIRAPHIVLATHVPINDRGAIWMKMHVTRTYVVAAPIDGTSVPDAMFWDTAEPYHYTRVLKRGTQRYLIVGGEDRDIGHEENAVARYEALEQYSRERFGIKTFTHRWSGQINEPADMLPLIGESSHGNNVWMSTGYSGTGMTYGTVAAIILTDLVLGKENRFADLYDPTRKRIKSLLENLAKVAEIPKRLIAKVTDSDVEATSLTKVEEGDGKIVEIDGEKLAVARVDGRLYKLSPTCTHMGCTVSWNSAESSWDCGCHGSRFDLKGRVLNGPATMDLEEKG